MITFFAFLILRGQLLRQIISEATMSILSLLEEQSLALPALSTANELGCVTVSGPDAVKFLQGQTSCDFHSLTDEQSLFGAICNLKGRVIVNFYALLQGDDILLIMSQDLVSQTLLHLKKYAVFFKVDMSDSSDHYVIAHLFSPADALQSPAYFTTYALASARLMLVSHHEIKHELVVSKKQSVPTESTQALQAFFSSHLGSHLGKDVIYDDSLRGLAIFSGQPIITQATSEKFIPQMLNMQLTQGISFKKGCYTGQEIVARMQYRGNLKKRAYLFSYSLNSLSENGNTPPRPLTKLTNKEAREVADVVCATSLFERVLLMAVIGDTELEHSILIENTELTHSALPYSLDEAVT